MIIIIMIIIIRRNDNNNDNKDPFSSGPEMNLNGPKNKKTNDNV